MWWYIPIQFPGFLPPKQIRNIPMAMMVMTVVCRITDERFPKVRKYGEAIESSRKRTIRLANGRNLFSMALMSGPERRTA